MAKENNWVLILMMLIGIVLGGALGQLASNVSFLSWLNYGDTFGLSQPLVLDLGILSLTFAVSIKISIAGIIGVILAIVIYRFL